MANRPFFSKRERAAVMRGVRLVTAATLMTAALFAALALASYYPEDPGYYVSTSARAQNWLGGPGAMLADILRKTFGIAAFYLPVFVGLWAARLGLARWPGVEIRRIVTAPLALICLSAFASSHAFEAAAGGGLGGIVGDYLFSVLGKGAPIDSDRARLIVGAVLSLALSTSLILFSIGASFSDLVRLVRHARWHLIVAGAATVAAAETAYAWASNSDLGLDRGAARLARALGMAPAEPDAYATGSVGPAVEPVARRRDGGGWMDSLSNRLPRRPRPSADEAGPSLSVPRAPRDPSFEPDFAPSAAAMPGMSSAPSVPRAPRGGSSFSALDDTPRREPEFEDSFRDPSFAYDDADEPAPSFGDADEALQEPEDWLAGADGDGLSDDDDLLLDDPSFEDALLDEDAFLDEDDASDDDAPTPDPALLLTRLADTPASKAAEPKIAAPKIAEPVATRPQPQPAPAPRPAAPAKPEAKAEEALPSLDLLTEDPNDAESSLTEQTLAEQADRLQAVLNEYGVRGDIIDVHPGPVVSQFELEPAPGLKASRVVGLADDIARSMSAVSARIARIPGRNTIGIELPNTDREIVSLRALLEDPSFAEADHALPLALGRDIAGEPFSADLAAMPHLLIGGATGSGKSVAINTMLLSLLYARTPEETRLILIDPKMLELSVYNDVPHLLAPVVTEPKKAVAALRWVVREMEERYQKMARLNVRSLDSYNQKAREAQAAGAPIARQVQTGFDDETGEPIYERQEVAAEPMPYIVVVIDEMADLMMVAGKEIEHCVQRLAQMARASGIHLIMATQRPSVDVITGVIKANFPIRISFQVTSKFDSRTILGEAGAEQLLGKGDMLFTAGGGRLQRLHGPFVSDEEVQAVVARLRAQGGAPTPPVDFEAPEPGLLDAAPEVGDDNSDAALYAQAVEIVARERRASTSFVQRRLQIGYNRAARLIEMMEEAGVVTPANRVGKREVLIAEPR